MRRSSSICDPSFESNASVSQCGVCSLIPPQYAQQAQGLQQPGVAPQQASELQGELSEDEALAQAIARSLQDL